MGDLNAHVGMIKETDIIEKCDLGLKNEKDGRFIELCNSYNQVVTITFFQHHWTHRQTWQSPCEQHQKPFRLHNYQW